MKLHPIRLASLVFVAPLLTTGSTSAQGKAPQLFQTAGDRAPAPGVGSSAHSLRKRTVRLEVAHLESTTALALELELFPNESCTVLRDRIVASSGGGFVWSGSIVGATGSDVLFSVVGDAVSGTLRSGDLLYRVRPAGNGLHWVSLADESAAPTCAMIHTGGQGGGAPAVDYGGFFGDLAIDVFVPYTPEAKVASGGTNAMLSLINLAVRETNDAYELSEIGNRLRLVHTEEMVGYVEPTGPGSFAQILNQLQLPFDGNMDEVYALRDQYGADAVTLLCENSEYCGMAFVMGAPTVSFAPFAFSVTDYGCATGIYIFGHELGHNFGSNHDPANTTGTMSFIYSQGFRTPGDQYRTIMAYAPGTTVKRFSNPDIVYEGFVLGAKAQNNARSHRNTGPFAALWRPTAPSPLTLSVVDRGADSFASVLVADAAPSSTVILIAGLARDEAARGRSGSLAPGARSQLLGVALADASGNVTFSSVVPPDTGGHSVWLQAIDLGTGRRSTALGALVN